MRDITSITPVTLRVGTNNWKVCDLPDLDWYKKNKPEQTAAYLKWIEENMGDKEKFLAGIDEQFEKLIKEEVVNKSADTKAVIITLKGKNIPFTVVFESELQVSEFKRRINPIDIQDSSFYGLDGSTEELAEWCISNGIPDPRIIVQDCTQFTLLVEKLGS